MLNLWRGVYLTACDISFTTTLTCDINILLHEVTTFSLQHYFVTPVYNYNMNTATLPCDTSIFKTH